MFDKAMFFWLKKTNNYDIVLVIQGYLQGQFHF